MLNLSSGCIILLQQSFISILFLLPNGKNTLLLSLTERLKLIGNVLTKSLVFGCNVIETSCKISQFLSESLKLCFYTLFFGTTIHHNLYLLNFITLSLIHI